MGNRPPLTEEKFSSIKIPVTISVGELDKMVTIEESENTVRLLSNGQFLLFENTPHPFEKVNHLLLAEQIKKFMLQ
jgi:hypothetical protein